MPSIFTRSRTASSPAKTALSSDTVHIDEFGRVTSRTSTVNSPASKKDKKKDKTARQRTQSSPHDPLDSPPIPDGSFLPFACPNPDEEPGQNSHHYGYLSYQCGIVLGLEEVIRLVEVVSDELNQRGLTTPLLFSSQAIDISPTRIKRLIDSFLRACTANHHPGSPIDLKWREEAQFSGPHDLGMLLRWGLARIVRIFHGQETRGILSWENYLRWREDEAAAHYPPHFFSSFLPPLPQPVQHLLTSLLSLLSRLATHATSSGLTPSTLSSLFGPLLFGLGSPTLPFHHTYGAYLRCSHATEHLLLAFIRTTTSPLPARLKDWIRGYPATIPSMDKLDKARPGARSVRVTTVKRNVRLYSYDLVKSAAGWAKESTVVKGSKEWTRVMGPPAAKLVPKYSDAYRKRLDIPPSGAPDVGSGRIDPGSTPNTTVEDIVDEQRFRSLTDLKWGEFESSGFGDGNEKRLEFDLNEGARLARNEKRTTLSWNDFSTAGFTRTDAPLSATLQFSAPLSSTISAWPAKQTELQHKLKKAQKALPPFAWDTTPVIGGEEAVEEGFVDIFCDLVYGSGWVDRSEQTFRDCNWALVEYKSMPQVRSPTPAPTDPRTGVSMWLYEEFVPPDYRAQLTAPKRKIPFWKPTPPKNVKNGGTLSSNGRIIGSAVPNARELEFEGLLNGDGGNVTKVISLGLGGKEVTGTRMRLETEITSLAPNSPSASLFAPGALSASASIARRSRFLTGGAIRKRSHPAEYDDALDFETRTMFADEDESRLEPDGRRSKSSAGERTSKDDAWVDILVGSQRRMNEQAADFKPRRRAGVVGGAGAEADAARVEIENVIAAAGPVPRDLEDEDEDEVPDEVRYGAPDDDAYDGLDEGMDAEHDRPIRDSLAETDYDPIPDMELHSAPVPLTHSRSESGLLPPSLQLNTLARSRGVADKEETHGPPMVPGKDTVQKRYPADAPTHHLPTDISRSSDNIRSRVPVPVESHSPIAPQVPPKLPTKGVSSLIELYREREKETLIAQSKIPVRSSSLKTPEVGADSAAPIPVSVPVSSTSVTAPVTPTAPATTPVTLTPPHLAPPRSSSPHRSPSPKPELGDELQVDGFIPSPGAPRYVHGAPLHNVVEAPEEEEEL